MPSLDGSRIRIVLGLVLALLAVPALAFAQLPDVVVSAISSPPTDANPGDSFILTVVVTNQGTGPTSVPPQSDNATVFNLLPVSPSTNPRKNLKGLQIIKTPLAPGESDGATTPVALAVYSDTLPGTYQVQACADGKGFVTESLEANNCLVATGVITIHQVPDLVVSAITNPPVTAGQGQTITVQNVITNSGAVAADPSTTKYSLVSTVDGTTRDMKGPLAPSTGVPALGPGESFPETESLIVRAETTPGLYRLQACADGGKLIPEQDNNNNCRTSIGTISITARPDLVITSVTVSTALTLHAGDPIQVSTVVKNQGLVAAASSTLKLVLINTVSGTEKNLKGTLIIPPLAAGASATVASTTNVTVYSDTLSGTYTVQVCADSAKVVAESIESNNCEDAAPVVTIIGSVVSHADLAVTSLASLTCAPETCANAIPGTSIAVIATVTNQGTDPVDASVANPLTIGFSLVQGLISKNLKKIDESVTITQPLAPGVTVSQPMTVQIYSDTLPGTYAVRACADGPKLFAESNENNNCSPLTGSIVVHPVPNLIVTSVQNPPVTAQLGDTLPALLFQVKNVGTVRTSVPTRTKFNLVTTTLPQTRQDLKGPSTATVPALGAGIQFNEVEALTIRMDTALGEYFLEACADGDKVVTEIDENDNCKISTGKINVTGLPDYVVTAVSVAGTPPVQVRRGGTLVVSATVKNQGIGDATKDSVLKFVVVSTTAGGPVKNLNGTRTITRLSVGKTASVSNAAVGVFLDTPLGTYTVQACADATNVLRESATGSQGTAETNNCTNTTTTVTVIP